MAQPKSDRPSTGRKRSTGPSSKAGGPGRRKSCFFCKSKVDEVDYKNVNELRRYVSEKGKIRNRRISGACRRHQRDRVARLEQPADRRADRRRNTVDAREVHVGQHQHAHAGDAGPTTVAHQPNKVTPGTSHSDRLASPVPRPIAASTSLG